ncbi:PepSY domain-containing protein [Marinobacterium sp. AK62]|uniref:PepSY domain-containing protein n=1 Tax=Marinobacterium alkalitolerans TaxID=1542925 RepID=A0ABS3Z648_9GAMM|nr:PepSY domain-containing protein [Marinobacterium alkalitolerans]MBP0047181.1 PepSY domain-containing protein [Marinobacterium alkalitolerans]
MEINQVDTRLPGLKCYSLCLLLSGAGSLAAEPLTLEPSRADPAGGTGVNLVEASEIARQQLGGEVIKAELAHVGGGRVYKVRLLEDGRVRDVMIDAASGTLLKPELPEQTE